MKTMKRFLAALLCLCMVFVLLPTVAQALDNNVTLSVTVDGEPFVEQPLSVRVYDMVTSGTGTAQIVYSDTLSTRTNEKGVAYLTLTPWQGGGARTYLLTVSSSDGLYTSPYQDNGSVTISYQQFTGNMNVALKPTKGKLTILETYGAQSHIDAEHSLASQSFTITGPNNYSSAVTLDKSNSFRFTTEFLTPGVYTVTENPTKDGYTAAVKINGAAASADASGNYSSTVTVTAGTIPDVKFENSYTSIAPLGNLRITKSFGTDSAITNGSYHFSVTGGGNYSKTFTLDSSAGFAKEFYGLQPGDYTVTELSPPTVVNGTHYLLTVTANSNGAGAQTIAPVSGNYSCTVTVTGNQMASAAFTNGYAQTGNVTVTVHGESDTCAAQPIILEKTGVRYEAVPGKLVNGGSIARAEFHTEPGAYSAYMIPLQKEGYSVVVQQLVSDGLIYHKTDLSPDANGRYSIAVTSSVAAATYIDFGLTYTDIRRAAPACTFSFDGVNAGKLMGAATAMEYSLDGGTAWTDCTADMALAVGTITVANDIRVRLKATSTEVAGRIQTIDITKADPPNLTVTQPAAINARGSVPMTTAHEYKRSADTGWTAAAGTTQLVPGEYRVRVKAAGQAFASEEQTLTVIAFDPAKEVAPGASFTATGANTGRLSGVTGGMKYSTNGVDWTDIPAAADIDLTGLSACTLSLVKKGNGTTTEDSDAQTIDITKADIPTAAGEGCTTSANRDGKLTGVSDKMEYRLAGRNSWIDCGGSAVTGLAAGRYQVRVKAVGAALASETQEISIKAYRGHSSAGDDLPGRTDPTSDQTLTTTAGDVAILSVEERSGTAYQWYLNRNDGSGWVKIPGATDARYTTGPLAMGSDGYRYRCVTSSAGGSVIGRVFTLRVTAYTANPDTGDQSHMGLWMGLLLLAGAGLAGSAALGRKKRHEN